MEAIFYLFRTEPDTVALTAGAPVHWLLMAVALLGVVGLLRFRSRIPRDRFEKTVGWLLLAQSGLMYLWYHVGSFQPLEYGLPFYTCRMSILMYATHFLTGRRFLSSLALYWGFYGSVLALSYMDLHPFSFPHYTVISYFLGHILLLWSVVYTLFVEKYRLTFKGLRQSMVVAFVFNLCLFAFDRQFGVNYNYLVEPPLWREWLGALPPTMYFLGIQLFFLLVFAVSHVGLAAWQRRVFSTESESGDAVAEWNE